MARYIDAERFGKDITGKAKIINGKTYFECDFVYETLWKQPTADVVEVKHGHWKANEIEYMLYGCSNCDCRVDYEFNYCPNCGARMDGGEKR